jgi:hypothetical protein
LGDFLLWELFYNYRSCPITWATYFHGKSDVLISANSNLGDFFSQTHLVTLPAKDGVKMWVPSKAGQSNGDSSVQFQRHATEYFLKMNNVESGVDVMITIFGDFCQFSAEKIGVFLEKQCKDQNFAYSNLNLFRVKNAFFRSCFRRKYFKNRITGPLSPLYSPQVTTIYM